MRNKSNTKIAKIEWPDEAHFQSNEITKWSNLPLGMWAIINKKMFETKSKFSNGLSLVLTLKSQDEKEIDVWAPDRLKTQLQENPGVKFILNKGIAISSKNPDREYFDFRLK